MKVTAFIYNGLCLQQDYKNSTLGRREASLLVVNSVHEMLHITLSYAYVTCLSVAESRVV